MQPEVHGGKARDDALLGDFAGIVASLSAAMTGLTDAGSITTNAVEAMRGSLASAGAASQSTSAIVQDVAGATEQLSRSIEEVSGQMESVRRSTDGVAAVMERTQAAASKLAASTSTICKMISVIEAVASQTRLLALNATIEAAHAGVHGKGFSVVAGEVKQLAREAAEAAATIGGLLSDLSASVAVVSGAVADSSQLVEQVRGSTGSVAAALHEQSAATATIAGNMQRAAHATTDLDNAVTEVRASADQVELAHRKVVAMTERIAHAGRRADDAIISAYGGGSATKADVGIGAKRAALRAAVKAHGAWKVKLLGAIHAGDRSFDISTVRRDDRCALGQWLHGDGARYAGDPQFEEVRRLHAAFHKEVAGILGEVYAGNDRAARAALEQGGAFNRMSATLVDRIEEWENAAAAERASAVGAAASFGVSAHR